MLERAHALGFEGLELDAPSTDTVERAIFFRNIIVLSMWMMMLNGLASLVLLPDSQLSLILQTHGPFAILYALILILAKTGRLVLSVSLFALGTGLAQVGLLYTLPGAEKQAIVSLLNLILVLGFTLGPRAAISSSVLLAAVFLTTFYLAPIDPDVALVEVDELGLTLALATTIIYTGFVVGMAVFHVTRAFVRERASRLEADGALSALAAVRDEELLQGHYAEQLAQLGERLLTCRSESALAETAVRALHKLLDLSRVLVVSTAGHIIGQHPSEEDKPSGTALRGLLPSDMSGVRLLKRSEISLMPEVLRHLEAEVIRVQLLSVPGGRPMVLMCGSAAQLERPSSVSAIETALTMLETALSRLRTERRLGEIQRLDAVGRLSAGVIHDVNNLLTAIDGGVERIANGRGDIAPKLERIMAASARAAGLTRKLLAFTDAGSQPSETADLVKTVRELRPLLVDSQRPEITLSLDLPDHAVWVHADRVELEQAVLNLVLNAKDAVKAEGRVDVCVEVVEAVQLDEQASPLSTVLLKVSDDGEGMTPEVQQRAFEPFFSTRRERGGYGLGLTSVYAVARSAGGEVVVDTELGRGSAFTMRLPLAEPPGTEEGVPLPESSPVPLGRLRVLLAEDDEQISALLAEVLREQGHHVVQVADGLDAKHWLEAEPELPVDLVISDVLMPRLGGLELTAWLEQQHPSLPIVLMSGYSRATTHEQCLPHIEKPFTPQRLLAVIAEVMERRRSAEVAHG